MGRRTYIGSVPLRRSRQTDLTLDVTRTRDGSVARHGGGILLAGQMVRQEAAAARQTAVTVGDVAVTTATSLRPLLRQQQASVLAVRRLDAVTACN